SARLLVDPAFEKPDAVVLCSSQFQIQLNDREIKCGARGAMSRELEIVATPLIAFAIVACSIPPVGRLARRMGVVAYPAPDSRHSKPTAYFGGISIVGAVLVSVALTAGLPLWMALGAVAMLAVGIVDDAVVL